jgi:hypothetical protein
MRIYAHNHSSQKLVLMNSGNPASRILYLIISIDILRVKVKWYPRADRICKEQQNYPEGIFSLPVTGESCDE